MYWITLAGVSRSDLAGIRNTLYPICCKNTYIDLYYHFLHAVYHLPQLLNVNPHGKVSL
jgi:hypothetical protein